MQLQAITYRGRTVAAATPTRFFLSDELEHRPPGDPELTFVAYMCAYTMDVLSGILAGPYNDNHACQYARAALIPAEFAERPDLNVNHAARALGVPVDELRQFVADAAQTRLRALTQSVAASPPG
jgi:hypothetical protein